MNRTLVLKIFARSRNRTQCCCTTNLNDWTLIQLSTRLTLRDKYLKDILNIFLQIQGVEKLEYACCKSPPPPNPPAPNILI